MTGLGSGARRRVTSLEEARSVDDGIVLLEGDWGGQTLVVARAVAVHCDEAVLLGLLAELDGLTCPEDNMQGMRLSFMAAGVGTRVGGGMGGGLVTEDVWCHAELVQAGVEAGVRSVLADKRRHLPAPAPAVEPEHRASILAAFQRRAPSLGIDFGWAVPEDWSTIPGQEMERQRQLELPLRSDRKQWWGATLRAVVGGAGFESFSTTGTGSCGTPSWPRRLQGGTG